MDSDLSSNGPDSSGGDISVGSRTRVVLAPKWLGKRVGRFKLLALLGQGAMGRVFRAEDTMMQRHVALKLLPRTVKRGGNSIGAEMLIREARAAASIEHVGAVQIYEINEAGDVYYIAMELLEGGSLRDLVKAAGPLDVTRSCLLGAEAAETLAFAHSVGVVHRDVKPANLMLNRAGRCKVVDFGLARVDDPSDLTSFLAESVGTPQFIAPEILTGTPASAQSDIYSLGGTVWYLLTGHPPFEAGTSQELLQKHLSCPLPDLKLVRPDVPKGLAEALAKALSKRPGERYSSMDQFAKVLRVHTIPLAASAADIETLTAAAGPPSLPPPPTLEGVEDPPLPLYQVPPSPRMSSSVSRPASPLDPRSSSSLSRPAAPVNRSMRPATPFDQIQVDEAAIEEPPADEVMAEQAAEEEPAAEVSYATPAPSAGPNWITWAVVGGLSVAVTIGIIIGCIFLLRPGPADVSSVSPPPQSAAPAPTWTPPAYVPPSSNPPVAVQPISSPLGDFQDQTSISSLPGSCEFSAPDHTYTVTGSGVDIFGKNDSFHFVWRQWSGDLTMKADISFSGSSKQINRKGCLMVRESLAPDSAYVDVAVHGNGLISLQWRPKTGALTVQTAALIKAPATVQLRRHGNEFTLVVTKNGKPAETIKTTVEMKDPVDVGLVVCSHDPKVTDTILFSEATLKR